MGIFAGGIEDEKSNPALRDGWRGFGHAFELSDPPRQFERFVKREWKHGLEFQDQRRLDLAYRR